MLSLRPIEAEVRRRRADIAKGLSVPSSWTMRKPSPDDPPNAIRVSELISSLSYALDLTEGRTMGHSVRACIIGMRIAEEVGMPRQEQADLYYTLLLKDAGCSSNSSRLYHILNADDIRAKGDLKTTDWTRIGWESLHYAITHVATNDRFPERVWRLLQVASTQQRDSKELVKIRCERGSEIARKLKFSDAVAAGIHSLDEHWNGGGYPNGLRRTEIPMAANIANLAQTIEVFYEQRGPREALQAIRDRSGRWFSPGLVKAAISLSTRGLLFEGLDETDLYERVMALEPSNHQLRADENTIDDICVAFADIIDAKTPFTFSHSTGVADAALDIGCWFGMNEIQLRTLRRAGLLHDVGKLGVSNAILEKPGKLTDDEFAVVREHPYHTYEILRRIPAFANFAEDAAAHHERLDGKGYWKGTGGEQLSETARILAVADVFDALRAKRPYRDALPLEEVFSIMKKLAPHSLDQECLNALMEVSRTTENLLSTVSPEKDPASHSGS